MADDYNDTRGCSARISTAPPTPVAEGLLDSSFSVIIPTPLFVSSGQPLRNWANANYNQPAPNGVRFSWTLRRLYTNYSGCCWCVNEMYINFCWNKIIIFVHIINILIDFCHCHYEDYETIEVK